MVILFDDGINMLLGNGFQETHKQQQDAVLVYQLQPWSNQVEHYGRFKAERAESKFGIAHAFRHDIDLIPSDYGSYVRFFLKV